MRKLVLFLSIIMMMAVSPQGFSVEMQSIYQTTVPVATESDEDRAAALQTGLAQVLVEVSGNSHILENQKLKSSLTHADDLVQEFSYSTPPGAPKNTPYLLLARFDQQEINHMLRDAGASMWGQSRPLIAVWLAYEAPDQPVQIIDSSDNSLQTLFKNNAKQRGLPLIFPMMDAEELGHITAGNILDKKSAGS